MIYGYARVSTIKQDRHGNSLDDQTQKLRGAGCQEIYHDSYTGTKLDRPEFTKLLNVLQPGDTLVVTKLDRFARKAAEGALTVQNLISRGVNVNILNMGRADNSPMGKLMVQIMLAFAEFERDMIVERTQTGKAVAREKGKRVDGRPAATLDTHPSFAMLYGAHKRGEITVQKACEQLGICKATWYKLAEGMVA